MALELIAKHRENAEVYHGADMCKKMFWELMEKHNLPKGLVPIDDEVTELGYDKMTGFMWLTRNSKKEHVFKGLNNKVYYDTTLTTFVQDRKMKQMKGIKAKELFITVTVCEMYITDTAPDKITFRSTSGITKAQPRSAFELED